MTMLRTQNTQVLELGYFIDEMGPDAMANYQALVRTIDDGVILPSQWVSVDDMGDPIGLMDMTLGCAEYISFVEIPERGEDVWTLGGYGLGFTQAFLERQGVSAVQYLILGEDFSPEGAADWLRDALVEVSEMPEVADYLQERASVAIETLLDNPDKRDALRERIAEQANDARTYYELIHPDAMPEDTDMEPLNEWRGTEAVHFTLADIQTVYVSTIDEVSHFRLMYPDYQGTFVVLS